MSNVDEPGSPGGPQSGPEPSDDLTAKIERLVELHGAGHLTDAEFSQAKATLLSGGKKEPGWSPPPPPRAAADRTLQTPPGADPSSHASTQSSPIPPDSTMSPNPHSAALDQWPGRPEGPTVPPDFDSGVMDGAATREPQRRSRKGLLAAVIVVALLIAGGAIAYSTLGSSDVHETVHGTFTILQGSYDPTNEFEDPNYTEGINGCEGDGGYGDLNSLTQVVVKDDHGEEVTRTELGEGHETGDDLLDGCKFDFTFDVSKGPKYFVVSVGHRGETKLTYEELSEPGAVELSIGP